MNIKDLFRGKIESPTAQEFLIAAGDAGEFAMTEVDLDYRKEREYGEQLWSCTNTALGLEAELDESLINPETKMWVDKDGRDVDVKLINGILLHLGESLAEYLDRFPILSTIIGDNKIERRGGHVVRLAKEISACGVGHYLRVIVGATADRKAGTLTDPITVRKPVKGRTIGFWKDWSPMRDNEEPWSYIARRACWAGKNNVYKVETSSPGTRLRIGPTTVNLDSIKFEIYMPKPDGSTLGYVDITMPGGSRYRARHIIRSNNATYGPSDELRGVTLISILDLLGERLSELAWEGERALSNGTYIAKHEHDRILGRIDKTIDEFSHLPGMSDKGDRVLREANIDSYEASVILPRAATPEDTMALARTMAEAIIETEFVNPLNYDITHMFNVSMASKNKPMTLASMLPPSISCAHPDSDRDVLLNHPLLRYTVNGWIDTDRQDRESRSVRFACLLNTDDSIWFTNGLEHHMPSITKRRRDALWVAVPGSSWFFSDKKNNGDMGRITPYGLEHVYKRASRPDVRGPLSESMLNVLIEEKCGPGKTIDDLRDLGWKITGTGRRTGRYAKQTMYERQYTCVGPSIGEPTWNKIYICGHKFVAVPTEKDYKVKVGDSWYDVCGFVPVESMQQKKLHGSMVAGLNVLLGATFIAPDSQIVHRDRKDGDSPFSHDDMVSEVATKLTTLGLSIDGLMPIYTSDGVFMGSGLAGVYPTFVLREDDKISTGVSANGCSRNALLTRMLGESISISKRDANEIYALSQFIAGDEITVDLKDITKESVDEDDEDIPFAERVK